MPPVGVGHHGRWRVNDGWRRVDYRRTHDNRRHDDADGEPRTPSPTATHPHSGLSTLKISVAEISVEASLAAQGTPGSDSARGQATGSLT